MKHLIFSVIIFVRGERRASYENRARDEIVVGVGEGIRALGEKSWSLYSCVTGFPWKMSPSEVERAALRGEISGKLELSCWRAVIRRHRLSNVRVVIKVNSELSVS